MRRASIAVLGCVRDNTGGAISPVPERSRGLQSDSRGAESASVSPPLCTLVVSTNAIGAHINVFASQAPCNASCN